MAAGEAASRAGDQRAATGAADPPGAGGRHPGGAGVGRRDIAERLFVGHRTVESHLARIDTKLGIRSRAELSRLLDGGTEAIVG